MVVIDSYSGSADSNNVIKRIHPTAEFAASAIGQSFAAPASPLYKITSATVVGKRVGSPGLCVAVIYAHSGVYGTSSLPTGSALATSDSVNASTWGTTNATRTFTFSGVNQIVLSASTKYCVEIQGLSGTWTDVAYITLTVDTSSPTHGGNYNQYFSGAWGANANQDLNFSVSGTEEPPPADPTGITATCQSSIQIKVTWTDNASNETAYCIERDDAGAGYIVLDDTLPANTEEYIDTPIICGTAYLYRVRAYNAASGLYSNYSTLGSSITCPCLSVVLGVPAHKRRRRKPRLPLNLLLAVKDYLEMKLADD